MPFRQAEVFVPFARNFMPGPMLLAVGQRRRLMARALNSVGSQRLRPARSCACVSIENYQNRFFCRDASSSSTSRFGNLKNSNSS